VNLTTVDTEYADQHQLPITIATSQTVKQMP